MIPTQAPTFWILFWMPFKYVDLRAYSNLINFFLLPLSRVLWAPVKPFSGLDCVIVKKEMPGYGRMAQFSQKMSKFLVIEDFRSMFSEFKLAMVIEDLQPESQKSKYLVWRWEYINSLGNVRTAVTALLTTFKFILKWYEHWVLNSTENFNLSNHT